MQMIPSLSLPPFDGHLGGLWASLGINLEIRSFCTCLSVSTDIVLEVELGLKGTYAFVILIFFSVFVYFSFPFLFFFFIDFKKGAKLASITVVAIKRPPALWEHTWVSHTPINTAGFWGFLQQFYQGI